MARVLSGVGEPSQPEPDPEVAIRMTIPEEFGGISMGELNSRRGCVLGMDSQPGRVILIRASLPASEYMGLEDTIAEWTQNRGRVEHEPLTN